MDINYTLTHTPPFFDVAMFNTLELGKKKKTFFSFSYVSTKSASTAAQQSWPKQ